MKNKLSLSTNNDQHKNVSTTSSMIVTTKTNEKIIYFKTYKAWTKCVPLFPTFPYLVAIFADATRHGATVFIIRGGIIK